MDFTDNSSPVNADECVDNSPEATLQYLHTMGAMLKDKRARRDHVEKLRDAMLTQAHALSHRVLALYDSADHYESELDELDEHVERLVRIMRATALPVQAYQSWSKSPASASEKPTKELAN